MKPLRLFLLFLLFTCSLAFSQTKFLSIGTASVNERGTAICARADGTYFVGGLKSDSALVMCLSSTDTIVWTKTFKYTPFACHVNYLGLTSDGYLIGTAASYGTAYYSCYFKIDPANGNFIWNQSVNNGNNQYFTRIIEKNTSQYILAGGEYPSPTPSFGVDAKYMMVSAATGGILFQSNCFGYQPFNWLDDLEGVTDVSNGYFYTSGRTYLQNLTSKMRSNLFKIDTAGNVIWSKYLHKDANGTSRMYTRDLIVASPTQLLLLYLADETCAGSCNDYYPGLMMLDTAGNVQWDMVYNISASNAEYTEKVLVMGGNIYVLGYTNVNTFNNNIFILKTDMLGAVQGLNEYGSPTLDEQYFVNPITNSADTKNGLIYTAFSAENTVSGLSDINILKVDGQLNAPCIISSSMAVTGTSVTPYQTVFPRQANASIFTTTANTAYSTKLPNACPTNYPRVVDTINVAGIDTVLNAQTPTSTSYYWNTGATTPTLLVSSTQVDSALVSVGCCVVKNHVFYVKFCNYSITVSGNTPLCQGQSNTLTATGATNYTWSPGGIVSPSLAVSPNITTSYTITGQNPAGCIQIRTITQTVMPTPALSISPPNPTLCMGGTLILVASGATSYTWLPSNNTSANLAVSPVSNTTYTLLGTAGSCSSTIATSVIVVPIPTVSIAGTPSICTGQQATLTASGAGAYTWVPGNFTGQVITVSPPVTTTYIVTGNTGGCTDTANVVVVNNNPTITATANPATVCPGNTTTLTALGAVSYTWLPGALTGNQAIYTPFVTSTYTVTGTNGFGCTNFTTVPVTVNPNPTITVSQSIPQACAGSPLILSATGASSYTWNPGNTTGASINITPTASTNYTVNGTLAGCPGQTAYNLLVLPVPTLAASGTPTLICEGSPATLFASGAAAYVWYPGSLSGTSITVSPAVTTIYTVTGNNGPCSSSANISVQVVPMPNPALTSTSGAMACQGASLQLSATGAQSFNWQPAGAFSAIGNTTAVITPQADFTITLTGTNSYNGLNCSKAQLFPISIVPDIVPSVSDNTAMCFGGSATLTAGGGNMYTWMPSGSIIGSTSNYSAVVSPSASVIYTVIVSYNGLCAKTGTIPVTVYPLPQLFAGNDTTYNRLDNIIISATGNGIISWISGDNIVCPGCPTTQVMPEYPKLKSCYVAEAVSAYGCKITDDVCIDLMDDYAIYIPNSFSPNGDGTNDVFYVYGFGFSDLTIDIFDRWGEKLFAAKDNRGWDGTYRGALCPLDTYVYKVAFKMAGKRYNKTGHVNIIK